LLRRISREILVEKGSGMERLKGIVPVLVSPVDDDGTPDDAGYRKLLDFTLGHPIVAYWILGSASEDFVMTYEDRLHVTKLVCEHVDGRVPVIGGAGSPVVAESLRYFDDTADMNVAAYHVLPTDRRMEPGPAHQYLKSMADRAPRPIWLYNNGMRGLQIPVPVVRDLKDHPNVAGIKAAGFDLMDIIPFCMMDGEGFQTIGSGGSHILLFLAMGCDAHTVSNACSFPGQFCEIYELWMAGKTAEAREKSFALNRLSKSLPHTKNTESCAETKAILELMGIGKRHVYPPFLPVSDDDMAKARTILTEAGVL